MNVSLLTTEIIKDHILSKNRTILHNTPIENQVTQF